MKNKNIITHKHQDLVNEFTKYEYFGIIDNSNINTLLTEIKLKIQNLALTLKLKKRSYHVTVEGLENILKHGYNIANNPAFIILNFDKNELTLYFGNVIHQSNAQILISYLKELEEKNLEEIKLFYRNKIAITTISNKGGAGLGLIEMTIKSNNQLYTIIEDYNFNTHFCLMKIIIS